LRYRSPNAKYTLLSVADREQPGTHDCKRYSLLFVYDNSADPMLKKYVVGRVVLDLTICIDVWEFGCTVHFQIIFGSSKLKINVSFVSQTPDNGFAWIVSVF